MFVSHVEALGATTAGRRLSRRWLADEPLLADLAGEATVTEGGAASAGFVGAARSGGWTSAGAIAAACRAAGRDDQERIVECLCRLGAEDELACLTVVSGLTVRLGSVLSGWSRAGAAAWELDGLASDLLSACWSGVAGLAGLSSAGEPLPGRVVCYLVDGAVEAVRVPRRRERRRAGLRSAFVETAGCGLPARSVEEELAVVLVDAVRDTTLSRAAAVPLFLTRVVGVDVAETARRLGCTPAVVRAVRSRAARRLAATA